MSDGSWEVQNAVYNLLSGLSPALAAGGIHASAPQDHPLPYVEIGEADTAQLDVQCRAGLDEFLTVHVWTPSASYKDAKQIMSRIREALHAVDLIVDGRATALATVRNTRLFTDEDGKALHGVLTLRVVHHAA